MSPCNASATNSGCCYANEYCLTNGLCINQALVGGNRLSRVGCTDKTWEDPACFQECKTGFGDGGIVIFLATDSRANGTFCCGQYDSSNQQCSTPNGNSTADFDVATGLIIMDRKTGRTSNPAGLGLGSGDGTSQTTVTVTSTAATATTTVSGTTAADSSAEATCPASDNDVGAIAGVGGGLGAALLIVTGLWIWQWSKARKLSRARQAGYTPYNGGYAQDHTGSSPSPSNGNHRPYEMMSEQGKLEMYNGRDRSELAT